MCNSLSWTEKAMDFCCELENPQSALKKQTKKKTSELFLEKCIQTTQHRTCYLKPSKVRLLTGIVCPPCKLLMAACASPWLENLTKAQPVQTVKKTDGKQNVRRILNVNRKTILYSSFQSIWFVIIFCHLHVQLSKSD